MICFYFNFRLDPGKPITLAQKTLFTFWMSVIVIWLCIKLAKVLNYVRNYKRNYNLVNDDNSDAAPVVQDYLNEGSFKTHQKVGGERDESSFRTYQKVGGERYVDHVHGGNINDEGNQGKEG